MTLIYWIITRLLTLVLPLASEAAPSTVPPPISSAIPKASASASAGPKPQKSLPTQVKSPTPKPKTAQLPPALAQIEKKYVKAGTLFAEFIQTNEVAATGQKKKSSGVISIKHPNKVRWETLKPEKNLLVSDGRTFWFYTPPFEAGERGQVIEKRSSQVQSKLANLLLAGSFSSAKDVKIETKSPTHFVLTPKKGTAGTVQEAEIHLNAEKGLMEKIVLHNLGGNRSEISLSNIKLGEDLDERFFTFVTPPGTDRVSE